MTSELRVNTRNTRSHSQRARTLATVAFDEGWERDEAPREAPMLRMFEFIATVSSALFAGAAIYINLVEHPARMSLDTRAAASEWAPSYRRATWMQAPLAVLSLLTGTACWLLGASAGWAGAAVLIGLVVPFTLLGIMPTNQRLLQPGRDLGSQETRELLERWARLHAVRTVLSSLATGIYLALAVGF